MDILERAIAFACEKHNGQRRKLASTPFILHPLEAATVAATMTDDINTIMAAILHDTVEDTDTTIDEIRENFGERVAYLVSCETENKRKEMPASVSWYIRKKETLDLLESETDIEVKKMWLADKLSNVRSFLKQYKKCGNAFWEIFNQKDPAKQAWYYRQVAKNLSDLSEYEAYTEYVAIIEKIFEGIQPDISKENQKGE